MNQVNKIALSAAIYAIIFSVVFIPAIGIWVFRSSMEARSYNRIIGTNVSTWDAMWVELRVQGDTN